MVWLSQSLKAKRYHLRSVMSSRSKLAWILIVRKSSFKWKCPLARISPLALAQTSKTVTCSCSSPSRTNQPSLTASIKRNQPRFSTVSKTGPQKLLTTVVDATNWWQQDELSTRVTRKTSYSNLTKKWWFPTHGRQKHPRINISQTGRTNIHFSSFQMDKSTTAGVSFLISGVFQSTRHMAYGCSSPGCR